MASCHWVPTSTRLLIVYRCICNAECTSIAYKKEARSPRRLCQGASEGLAQVNDPAVIWCLQVCLVCLICLIQRSRSLADTCW